MSIFFLFYLMAGVAGFLFWYSKDYDVKLTTLPLALLAAMAGPFAWILGWIIHGNHKPWKNRVLLKKRG